MDKKTIGEIIKERREELGYSFGKLSTLSGVDKAEISRIESGDRKNPNPLMIKKIAKTLELNIIEIYREMGLLDNTNEVFLSELLELLNNDDLIKILEIYQKEISYQAMINNKVNEIKDKVEGIQKIIDKIKT